MVEVTVILSHFSGFLLSQIGVACDGAMVTFGSHGLLE